MSNILPVLGSTSAFLALVLGFAFIIFVHELGHFLVAKAVGIKCHQFAIGFGTAIFSFRKGIGLKFGSTEAEVQRRIEAGENPDQFGDTEYRVCWLPLGGYVKMLGQEDIDPAARSDDPRSFTSKPVWARACVLSAGVVMNIIFGALFFIIAFMAGVAFPPAVAGFVFPDMPAAQSYAESHDGDEAYRGIRIGDRIIKVDDKPIGDFMELALATALARHDHALKILVERAADDRSTQQLTFVVKPQKDRKTKLLSLGIGRPVSLEMDDEPSMLPTLVEAGVGSGMKVVAVNHEPTTTFARYLHLVTAARGVPVPVTFTDPKDGTEVTTVVAAEPSLMRVNHKGEPTESGHLIGLVPAASVLAVTVGSAAEVAGLLSGDVIERIDGMDWPTSAQVREAVKEATDPGLSIAVRRGDATVRMTEVKPRGGLLGIRFGHEPFISHVLVDTPAAVLDINSGSRITHIADKPVHNFADVQRLLQDIASEHPDGASVSIGVQLNVKGAPKEQVDVTMDEPWVQRIAGTRWHQPIMDFKADLVEIKANNPIEAAALGIEKTHQSMLQVYVTLARLFQRTIKLSHLRGPVGIAHEGTKVAQQGWTYLMFFLGLISVNLAVINFLPIPIVDGGLMVFLIVEKLKGSPVSPRIQVAATVVGLAMIASIFLITLFYDSSRLIAEATRLITGG